MVNINELPVELFLLIVTICHPNIIRQVCKQWYHLSTHRPRTIRRSEITTLPLLNWALSNGCPLDFSLTWNFADTGNVELFNHVKALGCPYNHNISLTCSKKGHLEMFTHLYENNFHINTLSYRYACSSGNLELVKYMQKIVSGVITYRPGVKLSCGDALMRAAAAEGHLEIVTFLYENDYITSVEVFEDAAGSGNILLLDYLSEKKCPHDYTSTLGSVFKDRVSSLKYLISKGHPVDLGTCANFAVILGHLNILKYLISLDVDDRAINITGEISLENIGGLAGQYAHFNVIKYLHAEKRYMFDSKASISATCLGRLDVLKYLHSNGCDVDIDEISISTANYGHLNILEYILPYSVEHGSIDGMYVEACRMKQLDVLKYIYEHTLIHWGANACITAARYHHLEMIKYMVENGRPWSVYTFEKAMQNTSIEIKKYLMHYSFV